MSITITTPAIILPAISLMMLAYTNRFLALSQLIRLLSQSYKENKKTKIFNQIKQLRLRILMIKYLQSFGALSIIFCLISIICLLLNYTNSGKLFFMISLCVCLASMVCTLIEILISSNALNIELSEIEFL